MKTMFRRIGGLYITLIAIHIRGRMKMYVFVDKLSTFQRLTPYSSMSVNDGLPQTLETRDLTGCNKPSNDGI